MYHLRVLTRLLPEALIQAFGQRKLSPLLFSWGSPYNFRCLDYAMHKYPRVLLPFSVPGTKTRRVSFLSGEPARGSSL